MSIGALAQRKITCLQYGCRRWVPTLSSETPKASRVWEMGRGIPFPISYSPHQPTTYIHTYIHTSLFIAHINSIESLCAYV